MKDTLKIYKLSRIEFLKILKEKEKEIEKMKANRKQYVFIERAIKELKVLRSHGLCADMVATVAHERDRSLQGVIGSLKRDNDKLLKGLKLKSINEIISYDLSNHSHS